MQFDYRHFHIDCRARHADDGLFYARAKITLPPRKSAHAQAHDSGDIDAFASEGDAIACAMSWAVEWCDAVSA